MQVSRLKSIYGTESALELAAIEHVFKFAAIQRLPFTRLDKLEID
jgi:hypothetical protein